MIDDSQISIRISRQRRRELEDNFSTIAEGVKYALDEMFERKKSPYLKIDSIIGSMDNLHEQLNHCFLELQRISIEGNLQEKDKATQKLDLKKQLEDKKNKKIKELFLRLKGNDDHWPKFKEFINNGWDNEDKKSIADWAVKFTKSFVDKSGKLSGNPQDQISFFSLWKLSKKLRLKKVPSSPAPLTPSKKGASK